MKFWTLSLLTFVLLLAPLTAAADHVDVIQSKLTDKCDMDDYLEIVKDFNAYYANRGYQAEIMLPVHSQDQESFFWVGRSPTTEAFGAAHDHWLAEVGNKGSVPQKLSDRFTKCSTTLQRSSWVTAP